MSSDMAPSSVAPTTIVITSATSSVMALSSVAPKTIVIISTRSPLPASSTGTALAPATFSTAPGPCYDTSFPRIDSSGLNGTVCTVISPPDRLNITSCCVSAVRLGGICAQYCEIESGTSVADFDQCIRKNSNGTYLSNSCQQVNNIASNQEETGDGECL